MNIFLPLTHVKSVENVNGGRAMAGNGSDQGGSKAHVKGFPSVCVTTIAAHGPRLRRHQTEKTTSGQEFTPLSMLKRRGPWCIYLAGGAPVDTNVGCNGWR